MFWTWFDFLNCSELQICSRVPVSVNINSVFVIDLKNVHCDDMGVWTWGGSNKQCVCVDEEGFVGFMLKKEEKPNNKDCYKVWKRYYSLKVSPDVKKLIMMLEGKAHDPVYFVVITR